MLMPFVPLAATKNVALAGDDALGLRQLHRQDRSITTGAEFTEDVMATYCNLVLRSLNPTLSYQLAVHLHFTLLVPSD
jgi:hypothetical protein